jgi:hypothetical protein
MNQGLKKGNPKKARRKAKKETKRYDKANKKIAKAKAKSPKAGAKMQKKRGYNYDGAIKAGIKPDKTGHWASRDPKTGEIFKGRKHPTIKKTKKAEKKLGYSIKKKKGVLYSNKKK